MIFTVYSLGLLLLAALPAAMVLKNLKSFHKTCKNIPSTEPSRQANGGKTPNVSGWAGASGVSLLIPARNEQAGIGAALESILATQMEPLEVIVLDDHSTDATAAIVAHFAATDKRIRLLSSAELPKDWNGKQHACWQLAQAAQYEYLLFMDADLRLRPDAISRMMAELERSGAALVSGFPEQITGTLSEKLLIPMMYFVLLGYLPLDQMRVSNRPEFGAGCGQLFLARRQAYFDAGGHQSICTSRHDGLQLPRSFRRAGFKTDLFDACDIAQVRMYRGVRQVTRGLLKNATEGIANSKLILVFTVLLIGGAVLPVFSLAHAVVYGWPALAIVVLLLATVLSLLPRLMIARRLQHSMLGVWLHPLAVAWFVALQWIAFIRQQLGAPIIPWRGRS